MPVKVKICGITSLADARVAADAGADALGFVFHEPSPRYISPAAAAAIIRELPPFPLRVGVFVNAPADLVLSAMRQCRLGLLQFHGDEPPDYCLQFGLMSMKAFHLESPEVPAAPARLPHRRLVAGRLRPGQAGRHRPNLQLGPRP